VLGPGINDLVGNPMDQDLDGANGQTNDVYTATVDLQSPDLNAVSLENPTTAHWGETITVTWDVSNIGSDPARENWYDAVYLSSDATFGSGDRRLYYQQANANPLSAGAPYERTASFALPLDYDPVAGNYYLLLRVDEFNSQLESNEGNNTTVGELIHIDLPARPDAVVTDITAPADLVLNNNTNTPVTISWTVTNLGTAAMTNWHDYVYLSNDNVAGSDVYYRDFSFEGTLTRAIPSPECRRSASRTTRRGTAGSWS